MDSKKYIKLDENNSVSKKNAIFYISIVEINKLFTS
jgi:hypothetical protein